MGGRTKSGAAERGIGTLTAFTAVLMWSLLALFTAASGAVPPFQLIGLAFTIGGLLGLAWIGLARRWGDLRQPWQAWVLGVGGLFGYPFFYFTALPNPPPGQARPVAHLSAP